MYTDLEIWLSENRKKFRAQTIGQTWRVVFDAHCSNGGRMNTEFSTACKELGFDVRPSANGGYVFGKVKK